MLKIPNTNTATAGSASIPPPPAPRLHEEQATGIRAPGGPDAVRDRVEISPAGRRQCREGACRPAEGSGTAELTESEKSQVQQLKQRDQEVRAHEQAHMAAGAGVVSGGANYQMQQGPDGKMYAVGGEVKIDTSPEREPQATIRKMQQVRKAALAPAQPSATDRMVAAQAAQAEADARAEASLQARQPGGGAPGPHGAPGSPAPPPRSSMSVYA